MGGSVFVSDIVEMLGGRARPDPCLGQATGGLDKRLRVVENRGVVPVHETALRLMVLSDPTPGANHEYTTDRRRSACEARDLGIGKPGPGVSQCLPAQTADSQGRILVSPRALRAGGHFVAVHEGHHRELSEGDRQLRQRTSDSGDPVPEEATQEIAAEYFRKFDGREGRNWW